MGNKKFEERGWGGSAALADKEPDCTVDVYMSDESKEGVTVLPVGTQQEGSSKSESRQEF